MKKILELGPEQFLSGIASGSQLQNTGLFVRAEGITAVRDPFVESDELGILQASPAPADLTGAVVEDTPIAWTLDPVDTDHGTLYLWGDDGYLYSINLSGDNSPVNINDAEAVGGMTNGANGLFVMNHTTGVKNVWYFRHEAIGYYGDLNGSPSFNNDEYTGLEETKHHPVHKLFDRHYFGNGRYIGTIEDDGAGGLTVVNTALDLEAGLTVTTLWDDGHYLVAGAASNPPASGVGSLSHGTTKIIFWDTNSSSWEREWDIPDSTILSIRRLGSVMIALTGRGLYQFTIDSPPEPILPFLNQASAGTPQHPSHYLMDVLGGAVVWGNTGGSVSSFGKLVPTLSNSYSQPYGGFGANDLTLVCVNAVTNSLFVGGADDELFRTKWTGDGTNLTDVSAETIFMDLKRWWQIGRVVVEFDGPLDTDDAIFTFMSPDSGAPSYIAGSSTFLSQGAVRLHELYCSLEARKLSLGITFNGGAVRIRKIEVWGDPIEAPTHTGDPIGHED